MKLTRVRWVLMEFPRSNALPRLLQITFSNCHLQFCVVWYYCGDLFVSLESTALRFLRHNVIFYAARNVFFFLNRRWSLALADFYPRYISLTFQLTIVWISYQARYCVRFGIFSDNTSIWRWGPLFFAASEKKWITPIHIFCIYNPI